MALYFLEYDLRRAHELDYKKMYDELKKFGAVRILESSWCFKFMSASSKNLRDHFKQFIDRNDGLVVSEVTDWATVGTQGNPSQLKAEV